MLKRVLIGTDLLISYLKQVDYYEGIAIVFRWIQRIGAQRLADMGSVFIATHFVSDEEAKRLKGFGYIRQMPPLNHGLQLMEERMVKDVNRKAKALLAAGINNREQGDTLLGHDATVR